MKKSFIFIITLLNIFNIVNTFLTPIINNYIFITFLKKNYNLLDENKYKNTYYNDPRIHKLGNIGIKGNLHSILAPIASHLIDRLAYNNTNIRHSILDTIPNNYSVLDLCCGIGYSTKKNGIGIDTSNEMLSIAKLLNTDNKYINMNAENITTLYNFDVITLFFATHEIPSIYRRKIIDNALKKTNKYLLIIDIDNNNYHKILMNKYNNGFTFLSGEPYLIDYLSNMNKDINYCYIKNILNFYYIKKNIIDDHIILWNFTKRYKK